MSSTAALRQPYSYQKVVDNRKHPINSLWQSGKRRRRVFQSAHRARRGMVVDASSEVALAAE